MKRIEKLDKIIAGEIKAKDAGVNSTLVGAYTSSLKRGAELLDFSEVIWDEDVLDIVSELQDAGVEEFTISSTFSSLIGTIEKFAEHGVVLSGLTKTNGWGRAFEPGEPERLPAFLMKISKL